MSLTNAFTHISKSTCRAAGHPATFAAALLIIVVWAVTGPVFHYSDTWQLFINTGTTIVTFLMVFLIQNTQNRDGAAMQIKLDELIRALQGAHNELVNLEDMSDEELEKMKGHYTRLAERARARLGDRVEHSEAEEDQAEMSTSRGSGKAATKASTA